MDTPPSLFDLIGLPSDETARRVLALLRLTPRASYQPVLHQRPQDQEDDRAA